MLPRFYLAVTLVTVITVSAAEPASFNCFRSGQDCKNGGKCKDGVCECGQYKLFDCSLSAVTGDVTCDSDKCAGHGDCVLHDSKVSCYCHAGWDKDDNGNCTVPRYKVLCGHNNMIINVNPYGTFDGVVYEEGDKENTCLISKTYNDGDVVAAVTGLPSQSSSPFTGGVAAVIKNNGNLDGTDSACSTVAFKEIDDGDSTTAIYSVKRTFIVQYHKDYLTKADEKMVVECRSDFNNQNLQAVMGSVSNIPAVQHTVNAVTVSDNFGSLLSLVNPDLTQTAATAAVGEEKCVTLHNPSMDVHIKKIVVTNNLPESDPRFNSLTLLENSCKSTSGGKLGSIWKGGPVLVAGTRKVKFCFGLFTIKPTTQLAIRVWSRLCPSGVSGCEPVDCSGTQSYGRRRKRDAAVQYSRLEITGIQVQTNDGTADKLSPTTERSPTCDIDNSMLAAVISLAIVAFFLFVIVVMVIVCRTVSRRPEGEEPPYWYRDSYFNPGYVFSAGLKR